MEQRSTRNVYCATLTHDCAEDGGRIAEDGGIRASLRAIVRQSKDKSLEYLMNIQ